MANMPASVHTLRISAPGSKDQTLSEEHWANIHLPRFYSDETFWKNGWDCLSHQCYWDTSEPAAQSEYPSPHSWSERGSWRCACDPAKCKNKGGFRMGNELQEHVFMLSAFTSRSGRLNSIFLSRRPGLMRAGSRVSGLFVAIRTLMLPRGSKPSSWLISSNIVLWTSLSPPAPSSKRAPGPFNLATIRGMQQIFLDQCKHRVPHLPPMASISSKKIRQAFLVLAISNSSRTILAPYNRIWRSWGFDTIKMNPFTLIITHLSHIFLHQLRADDSDEAGVCAVSHGASAQGFSGAGRPKQQHAFWRLDTQVDKPLGLVSNRQTKPSITQSGKATVGSI